MREELLQEIIKHELTARQRQVMALLEDHTVTEAARHLGVRPSTVTRTRDRAYLRIRRCLRYTIEKRTLDKLLQSE